MPIIGVTDEATLEERRGYPEVGRLRKGAAKPERGPGRELPYFRFTSNNPQFVQAFEKQFGKEPTRFFVRLPYLTAEKNFSTWVEKWDKSKLVWRGNGVQTVRRWMVDHYSDKEADQVAQPDDKEARWTGRLSVVFPQLFDAGMVGVVVLATTGKHDCIRLASALHFYERGLGNLEGLEVCLYREAIEHTEPGGVRRTHYDVFLMPTADLMRGKLEAAREQAVAALPETIEEPVIDEETGEILDAEAAAIIVDEGALPPDGDDGAPDWATMPAPATFTEFWTRINSGVIPHYKHQKHALNALKGNWPQWPADVGVTEAWEYLVERAKGKVDEAAVEIEAKREAEQEDLPF
jgi:hypothetical protein